MPRRVATRSHGREYRALEGGGDDAAITSDLWERMVEVFEWPQGDSLGSRQNDALMSEGRIVKHATSSGPYSICTVTY